MIHGFFVKTVIGYYRAFKCGVIFCLTPVNDRFLCFEISRQLWFLKSGYNGLICSVNGKKFIDGLKLQAAEDAPALLFRV